jgi:hypothetical protein
MPLTNAGRDFIAGAITGAGTFFNASNARLGVGDSTTAFVNSQTDLQAATNKLRKLVDGAPGVAANILTFVATFTSGDANFAWQEFGVFNASTAGTMFSRVVSNQGTKVSGQVWALTYTQTIVNGD